MYIISYSKSNVIINYYLPKYIIIKIQSMKAEERSYYFHLKILNHKHEFLNSKIFKMIYVIWKCMITHKHIHKC